ncbi:1-acyl-sn-glycerol-3-phosphate acyltransferase [Candidatus Woesearchaeota archaeon]|nr:1-acyl-sn-glycerol-3-phosphate acyltransferase [Candidatus Woesearchaeota archaeon]
MVYPIGKLTVPPIYNLWLRKAEGIENVPVSRPFIIAANHSSYYDTLLPYTILVPKLNKKIHGLVNSSYWNNPITKAILEWGKCIPVFVGKNYDSEKNAESIKKALYLLNKGEIILIFPEGTRSPDGKLKKAYTGVARLVLISGAPVIPMGIIDAYKVLPRGNWFPRFKRCAVKFGKPVFLGTQKNPSEKRLHQATRGIMKKIAKLIEQEYNY